MTQGTWRQGQTCKVGLKWGWISYLLPGGKAIVTLDDGGQETVPVGDLVDPTISVGSKQWPSENVRPSGG